ncbi:MAG TPA: cytosolic protein, partial [Alcanivorax sp.]|nr:cytosolic protein [Alcanivorax sp.]
EAIEIMLAEFMAFYFPDAWQAIDWQQPHRFLDQELQKILPESGTGR